ncbi:MAG: hypothetical protein HY365_00795 [Candidatus Aenigmarchaeota archaeon]|nr:hypothetical protein [Candidatus Aenigmarchaeota archaeon]
MKIAIPSHKDGKRMQMYVSLSPNAMAKTGRDDALQHVYAICEGAVKTHLGYSVTDGKLRRNPEDTYFDSVDGTIRDKLRVRGDIKISPLVIKMTVSGEPDGRHYEVLREIEHGAASLGVAWPYNVEDRAWMIVSSGKSR